MLIIFAIIILYCFLVLVLIAGWNSAIRPAKDQPSSVDLFISLLIPVRNEAVNIKAILNDLKRQKYKNFEVIIIDDHSEDDSTSMAANSGFSNMTIIKNAGAGKKNAITTGIELAKGSLIVTTDADCRVGSEWLSSINKFFQREDIILAFGGVRIQENGSFFSDLQSIEFASLIGAAGATVALGFPTMCNGANLSYRKNVFKEVNGYEGNFEIASGDDEFLMRKVLKLYPQGISFIRDQKAIAETKPMDSLREFLNQRMRWASKWKHNSSLFTVALAFFILVSNIASLLCIIDFFKTFSFLPLIIFLIKALVEGIFIYRAAIFLKVKWNFLAFVVLQILYPFYVIFTGVISNFASYSWKGRKI